MIVVFTDEAGDDVDAARRHGRRLPQVRNAGVRDRRAGAVRPRDGVSSNTSIPTRSSTSRRKRRPCIKGPSRCCRSGSCCCSAASARTKSRSIPASARSACAGWRTKRAACISRCIRIARRARRSSRGKRRRCRRTSRTFFDRRVMRNYRPDYVSVTAVLRAAAIEQRACARWSRRLAAVGDHADGKRAAAVPASRRWPVCPRPVESPSATRPSSSRRSTQLVAILRQGERDRDKDHDAALAGRLRPGDGPGAGREGPHRGLQRDAGRGQAGPEVQG